MRTFIKPFSLFTVISLACFHIEMVIADEEHDINLDQLPLAIISAINETKQGIKLKSAERVYKDEAILYEVEGDYNGKELEILITPEGEVVNINGDG